jgi:release factor glutamine methyltransferase
MLGIIDRNWQIDKRNIVESDVVRTPNQIPEVDSHLTYFGLGKSILLTKNSRVFQVSSAGLVFGAYLVRDVEFPNVHGTFLDIGTGSGVHAILARQLGITDVVAADISVNSVSLAAQNERLNFNDEQISFHVSNLFDSVPARRFDIVAFNPPGWRSPSSGLLARLKELDENETIPPRAMFYGDDVVLRFLHDLPKFLSTNGRAIVGLNSLVGIQDVLTRYTKEYGKTPPLKYRLIERHTFPLLYYSEQWASLGTALLDEFQEWRRQGLAAFTNDRNGQIYWSYEIIEFSHSNQNA